MEEIAINPENPYIFKGGKFPGRSLEGLVFSKFGYVNFLYSCVVRDGYNSKNQLHEHLEWLMRRITLKLSTQLSCRSCGKPATYFLIPPYNYNIGRHLVCCDNEACKKELSFEFNSRGRLHSFSLIAMVENLSAIQKKQLLDLYKEGLGLDLRRLSDEKIFNILKSVHS